MEVLKNVCFIALYFRKLGIHLTITSDLPIGSGLGSSASFGVSSVSSLLVLCGFIEDNQDKWNKQSYELINGWALETEKIVHGTPSGIDNSISTYGKCCVHQESVTQPVDMVR